MKILLVSNYFYIFGGAERVFFNIRELLVGKGHEVIDFAMESSENLPSPQSKYFAKNIDFTDRRSTIKNFQRGPSVIYNKDAKTRLKRLIKDTSPDVALVHNVGRRLSNSIFDALYESGVPIAHMLHDYKPVCSISSFFRDGKICEKCMNHGFWNVTYYGCNQHSRSASFFDSIEKYYHWSRGTYRKIDSFIAPSKFIKKQLANGGLEEKKIVVIPHFIDCKDFKESYDNKDYAMFLGRLDNGKGVETLINAFSEMKEKKLVIAGDGPLKQKLIDLASGAQNIKFTGRLEDKKLDEYVEGARFVVVPSEWYEVFGMVIIESMARAKPVVGSNIAAIAELIKDGQTGLLYKSGDKNDLKEKVSALYDNQDLIREMGKNAVEFVRVGFSKDVYYNSLIETLEEIKGGK